MKKEIHPKYGPAKVTCGCGNTWETRSTKAEMRVEVCSKCHPFYTGTQKFVDTAGRVEKFQRKYKWTEEGAAAHAKSAGKKSQAGTAEKAPRRRRTDTPKVDLRPKVIKRAGPAPEAKPEAAATAKKPKAAPKAKPEAAASPKKPEPAPEAEPEAAAPAKKPKAAPEAKPEAAASPKKPEPAPEAKPEAAASPKKPEPAPEAEPEAAAPAKKPKAAPKAKKPKSKAKKPKAKAGPAKAKKPKGAADSESPAEKQ